MSTPQDPYGQLPGGPLDPAQDPDRFDPARDAAPPGRLDPAQDPDRYDPSRDAALPPGRLDPALDPDRYDRSGQSPREPLKLGRTGGTSQTLPDLLAEGSFDDKPSPYLFLLGLLGVVSFLLLVAFVFSNLSP